MTSSAASHARPRQPEISADLQDVAHQLHQEFDERLDSLTRLSAKFDNAKVRSFVPLLVRRYARDELLGRLERPKLDMGMG